MRLPFLDWVFALVILTSTGYAVQALNLYGRPEREAVEEKDEAEATFELLEKDIVFPQLDKAALVLGNNGGGKTALVQILAGDNSKLMAVEVGGYLRIEDQQNKIGHSATNSKTLFPELVIDPVTKTAFYDCPGFADTRTASKDIAATFYTNKLTQSVENIKLVIVVNHNSLKVGGSNQDFMSLIRHVSNFVKDIPKYKDSIVLVATKVENSYRKGKLLDDKALLASVNFFLNEFKDVLEEKKVISEHDEGKKIGIERLIELVDIFLTPGKVALSRTPEDEGPISNDELMQKGKVKIYEAITKAAFSPVSENDFGFTVSADTKNELYSLMEISAEKGELNVNEAFDYWGKERRTKIESAKDWKAIRNELNFDHKALEAFKNNLGLANNISAVAIFLRNAGFSAGLELPVTLIGTAVRYNQYMDFFCLVGSINKTFSIDRFLPGLGKLVQLIERNRLWYGFLISMQDYLESYEVQVNKGLYNTSDFANWGTDNHNKDGIIVTADNFNAFYDKVAEKTLVLNGFESVTGIVMTP